MRWAAVASVSLASVLACGGRSEYFDDRGIADSGEGGDGGTSAGKGGKGGSAGGKGATGGSAGAGGSGGFAATGGLPPSGGFGGQPAGSGGQPAGAAGVGASGGFGANGGFGGFGGFGNLGGFGAISGSSGSAGKGSAGFGGASPGNCLECVTTACESAQECFADPDCVEGIVCGAGVCSGAPEPLGCWIECFDGDATLALSALGAALCLAENCQVACQG